MNWSKNWYYLVVADHLSCWTEETRVCQNTTSSGSTGLCKALHKLFTTFVVFVEIFSHGGPKFHYLGNQGFLSSDEEISIIFSSNYFPLSKGRAELVMKATKRPLSMASKGTIAKNSICQIIC